MLPALVPWTLAGYMVRVNHAACLAQTGSMPVYLFNATLILHRNNNNLCGCSCCNKSSAGDCDLSFSYILVSFVEYLKAEMMRWRLSRGLFQIYYFELSINETNL